MNWKTLIADRRAQVAAGLLLGLALGWAAFGRPGHDRGAADAGIEITAETSVWTCSMHPQIRQDGPGKCPLCGMDLIPLATPSRAAADEPGVVRLSAGAAALADVRTVVAEAEAPERTLSLQGRVAADETATRTLSAEFSGRIERLHAAFTGGTVRAGAPLFTVQSPELEAAQRELIEAARLRTTHPGLYAATRARLAQWGIPDARLDAILASGTPEPVLDVHARFGGTVLERRVAPGDYVGRGDPLYTLADLRRVWVLLDADEDALAWAAPGDSATFTVGALPGRTFRARVAFVDPVVDPRTRVARVRLEVPNPDGLLRPGQFVQATLRSRAAGPDLSVDARADAAMVRVPATAVLWTGPRSVVYVREAGSVEPVFRLREVVLGPRAGDAWYIAEGLEAGEEVVAHGVFAVDAAAQLGGGRSMMARPAAPEQVAVTPEFARALGVVTDAYLAWSAALVAGDADGARRHAGALHRGLDGVAASQVPGDASEFWRALHRATAAAAATDELETSRARFQTASDALIALLDRTGAPRAGLQVDWCPMADDDRGAYWVSAEEDVLNPYFGEMMLHCGERRRVLPAAAE